MGSGTGPAAVRRPGPCRPGPPPPAGTSSGRPGRRPPACRCASCCPPDAEDVVGALEGHAEPPPELPQPLHPCGVRAGQHSAERAGAARQRARLALRHGEVLRDRDLAALLERHAGALALHQVEQDGDQFLHGPGGPARRAAGRRAHRHHQQRVAGEHGGRGAEQGPEGGAVAAQRVAVDDVVVQQREVVHQPHGDRAGHRDRRAIPDGHRRQQRQRGPHRLAAARHRGRGAVGLAPAAVVAGDAALRGGQPADRLPQVRAEQVVDPVEPGERSRRGRVGDLRRHALLLATGVRNLGAPRHKDHRGGPAL